MQWKPSSQRGHQTWPLTESLRVSLPLARSACAHGQRTSLPSLDLKTVASVILQSEPKKIQNVQALSEWTNFQTPPNLNCHKNNMRTSFWLRLGPNKVFTFKRSFSGSTSQHDIAMFLSERNMTHIWCNNKDQTYYIYYIQVWSKYHHKFVLTEHRTIQTNNGSTNPQDTFASACSVASGASRTCACSGAAGNSFAPAGCVSEMCMFGKKDLNACIWSIQAWYPPFNRFWLACAEMQGQGGISANSTCAQQEMKDKPALQLHNTSSMSFKHATSDVRASCNELNYSFSRTSLMLFFIDLRFAASAHLPGSTARLPKKS